MTHSVSRPAFARRGTIIAALAALAALLALGWGVTAPDARSQAPLAAVNHAYSGWHDAAIDLPNTLQPIATLNVPVAGSYAISAKLDAYNTSGVTASPDDKCILRAGGN